MNTKSTNLNTKHQRDLLCNFTENEIKYILLNNNNKEACEKLNISMGSIGIWRNRYSIKSPNILPETNPLSKFSEDEIKEILRTNKNLEASRKLSLKSKYINHWRNKYSIKSPHSQSDAARKFFLNESYFENIDTEEKAYILGFIAADGNVSPNKYSCEIRIVLHPKDEDILQKINTAWDSTYSVVTHNLGEHSGFPGSSKIQKKLSVISNIMQKDLEKYFIVPNKTLSIRFPDIPENLDRHFLRGFMDGDGYIMKGGFGWTTNHMMANDIQRICIKHGFPELRRYVIKEHSSVVRGGPGMMEILHWVYSDATICLNRKKEMYDSYWKNRVYKCCRKSYPVCTKHVPCALDALPPVLGSMR